MSKKVKPVFEDAPAKPDSPSSVVESINGTSASAQPKVGPKSLTKEMVEKLEQFDAIVEQNAALLKEKDILEEKIAEYIAEINELKSKDADASKVSQLEDENASLKKENSELQKAYDKFLVRISDLNFENSKLTCQIQELTKGQCMSKSINEPKTREVPEFTQPNAPVDPYNPYANNGYSQWN